MSQKSIATVLLMIATALGGPVAVDRAVVINEEVASSVEITGPSDAAVGELIELKLTGSRPSWLVPVDDHRILDDTCLVTFREEGDYEVIGSAIAGGKTSVVRHVVTVGETPDESPDKEPEDTPAESSLSDAVYGWCEDADAPADVAAKLGRNFTAAASGADTLDELLRDVALSNRKTDQSGCEQVLARIQRYLFENLQGEDLDTHRQAFDEIGAGLTRYGTNK